MKPRLRILIGFVVTIVALALAPTMSSAATFAFGATTCEDVFSAVKSPVVKRAVRDITVKKLVTARKARAIQTRASSSISSTSSTGGANVSAGTKASTPAAAPQAVIAAPVRATMGVVSAIPISPRYGIQHILWLDEQRVLLNDGWSVDVSGNMSAYQGTAHQAGIVLDTGDGALRTETFHMETRTEDLDSYLVVAKPTAKRLRFDYHFLDRTTLQELRPPLLDVSLFQRLGDYFSYVEYGSLQGGAKRLGSVHDSQPATRGRLLARFDDLFDLSDDAATIVTSRGTYEFQTQLQTYVASPFGFPPKTISDDRGGSYRLRRTHIMDWEIVHTFSDGRVTKTDILASPLHAAQGAGTVAGYRLEAIMGEGANRTAFISQYEVRFTTGSKRLLRVYPVVIGDGAWTAFDKQRAYGEMRKVNSRFALLFGIRAPSSNVSSTPVWAMDVGAGVTYNLVPQASAGLWLELAPQRTTIISNTRYVTIHASTGYGSNDQVAIVRDLATTVEVSRVQVKGHATMVEGTTVLRAHTDDATIFYDVLTGTQLWRGASTLLPQVSPDGSRVAFVSQGKVSVEPLGPTLQTRRAF